MPDSPQIPIEFPLTPKPRAVVIGASSGIGEAIARRLAKEGYVLALLARREENLKALCSEINQGDEVNAIAYPHDVTDFEAIPGLFQKILQDLQRLDLIVYVSGAMPLVDVTEFNFNKERQMVEVNLLGAMAWLGQAATLFQRMGAGQIVGISSVAGDRGRVPNPGYNTSKAALDTYLEALRNRLTRHGVNVLTVKPGFVETALSPKGIPPEKAATDIWRAMKRRRQLIYTPFFWRYIMLIIKYIPSFIFRRLSF